METVYQFCKRNIDSISGFDQPGFKWKKRYFNDTFKAIEGVKELRDLSDEIKRSDVLKFFRTENYYHGFLSALIWGGISTRPSKGHKGDKLTSSAYKVLSLPKDRIEEIVQRVKLHLEDKEHEKAYNLFAVESKLEGLNVSFFTKILYFISESIESNPDKIGVNLSMLIYDKWTKVVHLLLLLEAGEKDKIKNFFGENYLNKFFSKSIDGRITNLVYCERKFAFEAYLDYCIRLNSLAKELSKNSHENIDASNLESFLFGLPQKYKNNSVSNNRGVIRSKIKFYVNAR